VSIWVRDRQEVPLPLANRVLRAFAAASNGALLLIAVAALNRIRLTLDDGLPVDYMELLAAVFMLLAPVLSLLSWFLPPLPSEERQLRAAIRVAELRQRLKKLHEEAKTAGSESV
jgi:hypothetical protein